MLAAPGLSCSRRTTRRRLSWLTTASPRPYLSRTIAAIVLLPLAEFPRITISCVDPGSAGLHPVHTARTVASRRPSPACWPAAARELIQHTAFSPVERGARARQMRAASTATLLVDLV